MKGIDYSPLAKNKGLARFYLTVALTTVIRSKFTGPVTLILAEVSFVLTIYLS